MKSLLRCVLVAGCALFATKALYAEDFDGHVVRVPQGDMLTVASGDQYLEVRLAGIEAPEAGEAFYRRSRDSLAQLCLDRRVLLFGTEKDGSYVGRAWCGDIEAAGEQVRRGMAWSRPVSAEERLTLTGLEADARRNKRGMWAQSPAN